MVRFITQLLIVSLLTLNIAWAADECAFTEPGQAGGLSLQADGLSPSDPADAGLDCDNWCHAWISHIALPDTIVPDGYTPTILGSDFRVFPYSSLAIPPPFHPPIV